MKKSLFIIICVCFSSYVFNITISGQTKYSYNGKWKKSKKLPLDKKEIITSLAILNYNDSIFPNEELLLFEKLEAISITGDFIDSLGDFSHNFRIDENKLSNFKNLKHVWLALLIFKEFPSELAAINNLEILEINHTNLNSISSDIAKFKKIKELHIYSNSKLSYIHPDICKLDSLKTLMLSNNNFKRFPNGILDIPNIETIDLSNYAGTGIHQNEFKYHEVLPYITKALHIQNLKGMVISLEKCSNMKKLKQILKNEENGTKIHLWYTNNDCSFR